MKGRRAKVKNAQLFKIVSIAKRLVEINSAVNRMGGEKEEETRMILTIVIHEITGFIRKATEAKIVSTARVFTGLL